MVKTLQICPTMPLKVGMQYLTLAVKILMLESSVYDLLNVEDLQTSVKANQLLVQSTAEQFQNSVNATQLLSVSMPAHF